MGNINFGKGVLNSELAESVGYKSGLSFSLKRMISFGDENEQKIMEQNIIGGVRIRAEVYENLYYSILEGTGYVSKGEAVPAVFAIPLYVKKMSDLGYEELVFSVMEDFLIFIQGKIDDIKESERSYGSSYDPSPFIELCKQKYGYIGYIMALDIIKIMIKDQRISPWHPQVRRIDWKDKADLEDLFQSENLETYYGSFLDQRYIDYLSNHFNEMGEMNWRKFEGLTGEYFKKKGFEVQLGPGRNDGGIDIRIWKNKEDKENPAMILIQCKRQKDKVKSEIVKALWADMYDEKASSGLIVTSNAVEPGAKKMCRARGYQIGFAERATLEKWIKSMRSKDVEIIV